MRSSQAARVAALVGGAAVLTGGLAACSDTSVLSLAVGDCLRSVDLLGGEVSDIQTVACSEPHDAEIYAETELDEGAYPGRDAVLIAAEDYCLPEFEDFAGIGYVTSELDVYPLLPTEDSWNTAGDRSILCVVVAPGDVTGSLQGSQR